MSPTRRARSHSVLQLCEWQQTLAEFEYLVGEAHLSFNFSRHALCILRTPKRQTKSAWQFASFEVEQDGRGILDDSQLAERGEQLHRWGCRDVYRQALIGVDVHVLRGHVPTDGQARALL